MPIRLLAVVLAACLGACSAVHECTDGDTQACGLGGAQLCVDGHWADCSESYQGYDASPLSVDAPVRADTSPPSPIDASALDTDPYEGDVFSPGACTWSAGPPQLLTTGPSGGMMLFPLALGSLGTLGTEAIHVPWTGLTDGIVRAQRIGADGLAGVAAQPLMPAPTLGVAYGTILEHGATRAALVGPTRGSMIVPLAADDTPTGTQLALDAGRCWDLRARDTVDEYTFLCAATDASPGITWHRIDVSGAPLQTVVIAADAVDAVRVSRGSDEAPFLVVAQAHAGITAQIFDGRAVAMAAPTVIEGTADGALLRGVPPVATAIGIQPAWLLALDTAIGDGTYGITTRMLDADGVSTRPAFLLPGVRSQRGIASFDITGAGDDVMLVWTEWVDRGTSAIAMHALPLSAEGFPRGSILDLGRFTSAGVAPDAIHVASTSQGTVVVYHARDTSISPDLQLYSRLLTCR